MNRFFLQAGVVALGLVLGQPGVAAGLSQPSAWPAEINPAHLPWQAGEALTYRVSWLGLDAAEGTFVAHDEPGQWEFKLALRSLGAIDQVYPFTGTFWSILSKAPWRSIEYGEYRFEPSRTIKERTRIDYALDTGTREQWVEGKTNTFTFQEAALDDIGTMLYNLRCGDWPLGQKRTLHVYESGKAKQGEVTSEGTETRAFAAWPAQSLIRLSILPTVGTHRRGHLHLWLTNDARRLPIHADLDFRYGSFSMDLIKAIPGTGAAPAQPGTVP